MSKSKIEWTDMTSNPIHLIRDDGSHGGHWCRKISAGCASCYAEEQNQNGFFSWASKLSYTGEVPENLILDELVLSELIKKKTPKKIFMCSMTDLFGDWIPNDWIDKIFATMLIAKQHTFQILTKRPERMQEYLDNCIDRIVEEILNRSQDYTPECFQKWYERGEVYYDFKNDYFPFPNIWLGTTCENQKTLNQRLSILLNTPAKVRFLSCEPLLEEINLGFDELFDVDDEELGDCTTQLSDALHWVICGGESGNNARNCHLDWIRSLVQQCQSANIPIFVKQLGSKPTRQSLPDGDSFNHFPLKLKNKKGGNISEFPEDLQIREFPN